MYWFRDIFSGSNFSFLKHCVIMCYLEFLLFPEGREIAFNNWNKDVTMEKENILSLLYSTPLIENVQVWICVFLDFKGLWSKCISVYYTLVIPSRKAHVVYYNFKLQPTHEIYEMFSFIPGIECCLHFILDFPLFF